MKSEDISREIFPAGKPVLGRMLIGRGALLGELIEVLSIGQSVVLIAPRRYGKTSVAIEVLNRFKKQGYFTAEIDLFDIMDKRHLAERFIEACLSNNPVPLEKYWRKLKRGALHLLSMLKFKPTDEDMEVVLQLGMPAIDAESLLDKALEFAENFCRRHKKKMIFFLDEFQELAVLGGEALLKKMRARFQRHRFVTYVFAGSQETMMTELFHSKQHAFYRFGRMFDVGPIPRANFAPYIVRSFVGSGIHIEDEAIAAILDTTTGHPYYTQLLCQTIYIDCLKGRRRKVCQADISMARRGVLEHEHPLFDEIWRELGEKRHCRNLVSLVAQGLSPYSWKITSKENIARILVDLVDFGILSKKGKGKSTIYEFKDPFLKKYVAEKTP